MVRSTILLLASIFVISCYANDDTGVPSVYPTIISRAEWNARSPKAPLTPLTENPPGYVIIHHSETPGCTDQLTCNARVRSFQSHHMDIKGWNDIGYNFLIGGDGNVYEGRGWGKHGSHSRPYNSKSIGICFIGSFKNVTPNNVAIRAVKNLISYGVNHGYLKSNYKLLGHRQTASTDCPGTALYELIKTWPEWTANP